MNPGRFTRWSGVAAVLGLAACGQPVRPNAPDARSMQGDVSYREAPQDEASTPRYQLEPGQISLQPSVLEQPAPIYPATLLGSQLPPVEIPAQLAVNGEGHVYNVIVANEAQADATRRAFIAAVRQAALGWLFTPLVINHVDASGKVLHSEHPPFSQFFVFRFELRDGKPVSSTQPGAAPGGT